MAIIKACVVKDSIRNTGKECDVSMLATAMLIAIHPTLTFNDTDLLDFDTWMAAHINGSGTARVYPLFGQKAPIRTIDNASEGDILLTLDDGLKVFLRYGFYNRTFETTSGGLCYAKSLQGLNKSGYSIIEVDQTGQMLVRNNGDGTYGGLITDFMYAPSPVLADFKSTPYKNRFQISYSPVELVGNGEILQGATSILDNMGLVDSKLTNFGAQSIAQINLNLVTDCAATDLVALLGAPLLNVANFKVTKKSDGSVVVLSGVTNVSGHLRLAGTFTTATTYNVVGTSPSAWYGVSPLLAGYDASSGGVDVLIP